MEKILLVDDEIMSIQAIKEGVDWERCGVSEVILCESAGEAKAWLLQEEISLVISDIEMPGMDGLGLAKWIKQYNADIMVMLLTGFAEFEYAKTAISVGVEEYLLKPVLYEELENKIIQFLERKRLLGQQEMAAAAYHKNKSAFVAAFVEELLAEKHILTEEELKDCMKRHYVELPMEREYVLMWFSFQQKEEKSRLQDLQQSLKEYGSEVYLLFPMPHKALFLLQMDSYEVDTVEDLRDVATRVVESEEPDCCCYMSDFVQFGRLQETLQKIRQRDERNVFYQKVFLIGNRSVEQRTEKVEIDYSEWNALMIRGEFEELLRVIDFAIHKLVLYNCMDGARLKELYTQYMQMFYSYIGQNALNFQSALQGSEIEELQLRAVESVSGFRNFVKEMLMTLKAFLAEEKRQDNPVEEAKKYIAEHYSEKLTREEIASHVCLNESYLSRIFHRETGISISDYIMRERMRQAKKLLIQSNFSIHRIAAMTGYDSPAYFTKVFSKEEGVSPKDFRKREKI